MVYSRTELAFILEHYSASKPFDALREAFSYAYPGKELPNKTIGNKISGHRKCLSETNTHRSTEQLKLHPYQFQAVHQLQQRDTAARIQYRRFRCSVPEGVRVW
jgi:hypothetical protein